MDKASFLALWRAGDVAQIVKELKKNSKLIMEVDNVVSLKHKEFELWFENSHTAHFATFLGVDNELKNDLEVHSKEDQYRQKEIQTLIRIEEAFKRVARALKEYERAKSIANNTPSPSIEEFGSREINDITVTNLTESSEAIRKRIEYYQTLELVSVCKSNYEREVENLKKLEMKYKELSTISYFNKARLDAHILNAEQRLQTLNAQYPDLTLSTLLNPSLLRDYLLSKKHEIERENRLAGLPELRKLKQTLNEVYNVLVTENIQTCETVTTKCIAIELAIDRRNFSDPAVLETVRQQQEEMKKREKYAAFLILRYRLETICHNDYRNQTGHYARTMQDAVMRVLDERNHEFQKLWSKIQRKHPSTKPKQAAKTAQNLFGYLSAFVHNPHPSNCEIKVSSDMFNSNLDYDCLKQLIQSHPDPNFDDCLKWIS